MGLIDFSTLAAYEQYRSILANDSDHKKNIERLTQSGAVTALDRSIMQIVPQD